ncbi:DNA mismatch repair protein msh3 [Smittium mucronatum]|uniref:DNA mismatch repair protein MSH3 n=1 Tax=Smittium mucronatum TaxID=133383 RepID=A0A1R0GPX6_9FUNG|nr:DNA mismatch repair protein msh3 [Smittium mucronatum]
MPKIKKESKTQQTLSSYFNVVPKKLNLKDSAPAQDNNCGDLLDKTQPISSLIHINNPDTTNSILKLKEIFLKETNLNNSKSSQYSLYSNSETKNQISLENDANENFDLLHIEDGKESCESINNSKKKLSLLNSFAFNKTSKGIDSMVTDNMEIKKRSTSQIEDDIELFSSKPKKILKEALIPDKKNSIAESILVEDSDQDQDLISLRNRKASETDKSTKNEIKSNSSTSPLFINQKNVKYTPLELQYLRIKNANPKLLLAVEVGYKFVFYDKDAEIASKVLGIYISQKQNFSSCSVPVHRIMLHVRRLVYAGFKVGIVRQTETVAMKSNSSNKSGPFQRDLCEVYSRGTLIGEIGSEFESSDNPSEKILSDNSKDTGGFIFCVADNLIDTKGNCKIGIVAVDPSTGDIIYDEFLDDYTRTELETRLSHIQPVELVLSDDLSAGSNKMCVAKSSFNSCRIERMSNLSPDVAVGKIVDEFTSISAFNAIEQVVSEFGSVVSCALEILIRYLKVYNLETLFCTNSSGVDQRGFRENMSQDEFTQIFGREIEKISTSAVSSKVFSKFYDISYMRLDSKALESLLVIKTSTDQNYGSTTISSQPDSIYNEYKSKNRPIGSNFDSTINCADNLYDLINHAITQLGQRTLRKWILKPLQDSKMIRDRLEIVSLIVESEKLLSASGKSKKIDFLLEYEAKSNGESIGDSSYNGDTIAFSWILDKIKGLLRTIVDVESGLSRLRVGKVCNT